MVMNDQNMTGKGIWAVVALKSPNTAKSRLRPLLSDAERRDLYFIMARKVIGALKATPQFERVMVVTADAEVENFALRLGAEVIRQAEDGGTAAAFSHALASFNSNLPGRVLLIPGDLPLISRAALEQLIERSADFSGVCIVPDRKRVGTNALLCSPPDAIPPCFGVRSFDKHLAAARERGIDARVIESETLSLDIDVADDLALLGAHYLSLPDQVDIVLRDLLVRLRSGEVVSVESKNVHSH